MRLDPELAAIAAEFVPLDITDVPAARDAMAARRPAPPPGWDAGVTITPVTLPGPAGAPDVTAHVVRPDATPEGPLGGLVYFHGGGFAFGNAEGTLPLCARYARDAGLVVVTVEYRLAPENPFPAGVEDCYAATAWVAEHAVELGIDPGRLGVGGASAGGGLAAAVALLARDRTGPPLAYQLLVYPMLDDRQTTVSSRALTDVPIWTAGHSITAWSYYLRAWEGEVPPAAAPARAGDLGRLPDAFVLACEHDPLRDDDLAYAQRLGEAGVAVEIHQFPGTFHGYDGMPAAIADRTYALVAGALARGLGAGDAQAATAG